MPIIHVEMLTGRTREQKAALVKELTDGFVRTCGGKPDSIPRGNFRRCVSRIV